MTMGEKKHFRFYPKAAPFPGTCVFSGETKNLWEIGSMTVQGQPLTVLLSDRVLGELAFTAGFVSGKSFAELNASLTEKIKFQEAQIQQTPNLIKELQNGFNDLFSNFVTGLASVSVSSEPVQPESAEASTGGTDSSTGAKRKGGARKVEDSEPSDEPSGE